MKIQSNNLITLKQNYIFSKNFKSHKRNIKSDFWTYLYWVSMQNQNMINFKGEKHIKEKYKDLITKLYNEGKNEEEIAKQIGVTPKTIHLALVHYGLKEKSEYNSVLDVEKIKELIEQGKSVKEIAYELHSNTNTVYSTMRQADIPYGSYTERNKDKIIELKNQGFSAEKIAKIVDCSKRTILKAYERWRKNGNKI